ncbi:MAG TPA: hypothetical protein VEQ41_06610 [Solirubrobacterales bacterium]|nr:hypothetical protein [Solirubrobacterales bacterium]
MESVREAWTDERLDTLNGKVDHLGERVDELGERVDELGRRVDKVDWRMDKLEVRMDKLETRMDEGFEEVRGQLVALHRTIVQFAAVLVAAQLGVIAAVLA